jgi:hypothetical protein
MQKTKFGESVIIFNEIMLKKQILYCLMMNPIFVDIFKIKIIPVKVKIHKSSNYNALNAFICYEAIVRTEVAFAGNSTEATSAVTQRQ